MLTQLLVILSDLSLDVFLNFSDALTHTTLMLLNKLLDDVLDLCLQSVIFFFFLKDSNAHVIADNFRARQNTKFLGFVGILSYD